PEQDIRLTENISTEELQQHLESLKKTTANPLLQSLLLTPEPVFDERKTEFIPVAELQEHLKAQKSPIPSSAIFEEVPPNFRIYNYFLGFTPLGTGADALIFEAFADEQRTQPSGVIKIARKGHQAQLFKEIEFAKLCISREIGHENLVYYLQTGVTSFGQPFLVTERLFPYPHKQILFVDAVCIFSRMADLFTYLHKIRFYHRDIKPGNILYQLSGFSILPKLFDFGTASKQIQEKETAACSPYYAAPEVLRKIRGLTTEEIQFSRADIYSLGMTFLGLLGLNPYLTITPELEVKYRDPRALIDQLNMIQETQFSALSAQIENFLLKQYWDTSFVFTYGIRSNHYKSLVEGMIPILKKVLHPKPEERPMASTLQKSLESLVVSTLNCSSQQFLIQGGSLFKEGPKFE
ncbi:MAG: protein kinase, partial [Planctomycetota bacterium]